MSFVLHLDVHLKEIIARHGAATYGILFAIVFCETGLVLTPFLPGAPPAPARFVPVPCAPSKPRVHTPFSVRRPAGDSLLFAAGAFAALGSLRLTWLLATFFVSVSAAWHCSAAMLGSLWRVLGCRHELTACARPCWATP